MKRDRWVNWRALFEPARRERPRDVVFLLRKHGLMRPDGFWPTEKAIGMRFVRTRLRRDGKVQTVWDRVRYRSFVKQQRARRTNSLPAAAEDKLIEGRSGSPLGRIGRPRHSRRAKWVTTNSPQAAGARTQTSSPGSNRSDIMRRTAVPDAVHGASLEGNSAYRPGRHNGSISADRSRAAGRRPAASPAAGWYRPARSAPAIARTPGWWPDSPAPGTAETAPGCTG
jgi:hypothetical protein